MRLLIENVSKRYNDKQALDNIFIELREGVYGLIGPNGSGKTTLMRILADVLKPTKGRVLVNGQDKTDMDEKYRELLGYLPQEMGLYKNFTAFEFLLYISALKGIEKKKAVWKAQELLELVSLKDDAKMQCGKFSGGMKRRLGIAQALLNDPKILILDEPTVGLDPEEKIKFKNTIADISFDKIILYSTHTISDIEMIAKEVILLNKGKLLIADTGENLLAGMDGRVWKSKVSEKEYANLNSINDNGLITNISRKKDYMEIRIVSDKKPFENCETTEPSYEDMYIHYFKTKGGVR